jgi:hypothetical protein
MDFGDQLISISRFFLLKAAFLIDRPNKIAGANFIKFFDMAYEAWFWAFAIML